MDWRTLSTAFVGALGGTATALVLVGVFGKTLLEHWFKKIYKKWEAELEHGYKKKFKYLEAGIDRLSSEEKIKHDELHIMRLPLLIKINSLISELGTKHHYFHYASSVLATEEDCSVTGFLADYSQSRCDLLSICEMLNELATQNNAILPTGLPHHLFQVIKCTKRTLEANYEDGQQAATIMKSAWSIFTDCIEIEEKICGIIGSNNK